MTSLAFERQNPRARILNTRRALIQRPQMERLLEHAFVPNLRIQRQQAAGQVVAHCPVGPPTRNASSVGWVVLLQWLDLLICQA